jgi:hypothetical protein
MTDELNSNDLSISEQISQLNLDVSNLNLRRQNIKIPQRNIAFQFANLKGGGRDIENRNRIKRRDRRKINSRINYKKRKINILTNLLGE